MKIDFCCRLITLNGMKVSEEITEEQSRQVRRPFPSSWSVLLIFFVTLHSQLLFDVDHAYAEFFRSLSGAKDHGSWYMYKYVVLCNMY